MALQPLLVECLSFTLGCVQEITRLTDELMKSLRCAIGMIAMKEDWQPAGDELPIILPLFVDFLVFVSVVVLGGFGSLRVVP
jgi:hypothetical protein